MKDHRLSDTLTMVTSSGNPVLSGTVILRISFYSEVIKTWSAPHAVVLRGTESGKRQSHGTSGDRDAWKRSH